MRYWFTGALVCGLAAAVGLVVWQGVGVVAGMLGAGGWGLLWLGAFYALPVGLAAWSWSRLFARGAAPGFAALARAAWVGLAVNWLLPVAQIGGEIVKARLAWRDGAAGPAAGASVIADKTVQAFTQVIYTLVGLVLLVWIEGGGDIAGPVLAVTALFALAIYAFFRLQKSGLVGLLTRAGRAIGFNGRFAGLPGGAAALDAELRDTYARRGRLWQAIALRLAFRLAMAGEVWLALALMGHPVGIAEALVLESLGQAIRAAAFMVPAGLGVQEGGFMLLGAALGLGPEVGLGLSLAKRARELLVGLPGLVVWQLLEGRDLLKRRPREAAASRE